MKYFQDFIFVDNFLVDDLNLLRVYNYFLRKISWAEILQVLACKLIWFQEVPN